MAIPAVLASKFSVSDSGCWEWTASRFKSTGYGAYRGRNAHRAVYRAAVGPIPEGLDLDHLCRNRGCVNPAHLEPVTHRVNLLRGETIVAANAAKTHCRHGHPLAGDNLYVRPDGKGRDCRECRSAADRRRTRGGQ